MTQLTHPEFAQKKDVPTRKKSYATNVNKLFISFVQSFQSIN